MTQNNVNIFNYPQNPLDISVLLAEDDKFSQELMIGFMANKVRKLIVANDGKEGLDLFIKHTPDVLISDIRMPGMDGLKMIKQINNKTKTKTKIYITSAFSDREILLDAIDAGFDQYFTKPIDFKKLEQLLNKDFEEKKLKNKLKEEITKTKQQERYFKELFNNSLVGIYQYSSDGKILWANQAIYKMLGYSSLEELSNTTNAKDVYVNQEERNYIISVLDKKGHIDAIESKWFTKDKRIIYIRETIHKTADERGNTVYVGTVENITKEKRAELKLMQIAIEQKNLMNNANIPMIGIDKQQKITEWNTAAKDLFGYKKAEVIRKNFVELLAPQYEQEELNKRIKDAFEGSKLSNYKYNLITKQKKELKILLNTSLIYDYHEKIKGLMFIIQDITEIEGYRNSLEKKVNARTKELKLALDREKELGKLKSRFVAMASHEFRTPLTAINFAAEFLKKYDSKLNKEQKNKKFNKIESQVKHMTKLLESILHIERIETAESYAHPQMIKFKNFIKPIIEEVRHETNYSHKVELSIDNEETMIYIDKERGHIIFLNLLLNAIKYSPEEDTVYIKCHSTETETVVKIKDLGMGINPNEIELIYDTFYRGENVETIQGTGLGLSLVKSGVKIHNGNISVKSEKGKGTTFTLHFPLPNSLMHSYNKEK